MSQDMEHLALSEQVLKGAVAHVMHMVDTALLAQLQQK